MDESLSQIRARAFNQGSDARLQGKSRLGSNPYDRERELMAYASFEMGWRDVDAYWARIRIPGFVATPLPTIRQEEKAFMTIDSVG